MIKTKFILNLILFFLITNSYLVYSEDKELSDIFKYYNVSGTIVISSLKNDLIYIHNDKRAKTQLTPASTFKIPNSLIAIETKILKDQYELIPWDGVKRELEVWNSDKNLKSAFRTSSVWVYQKIAKLVGENRYYKYLEIMNYGNKKLGKDVTNFWLAGYGDLKISPIEQVEFLKKIYLRKFPFSNKSYDILNDIMLNKQTDAYSIYIKTGAATQNWVGHGWYVGFIETKRDVWFFATNIEVNDKDDLKVRQKITLESLKAKKIIY